MVTNVKGSMCIVQCHMHRDWIAEES